MKQKELLSELESELQTVETRLKELNDEVKAKNYDTVLEKSRVLSQRISSLDDKIVKLKLALAKVISPDPYKFVVKGYHTCLNPGVLDKIHELEWSRSGTHEMSPTTHVSTLLHSYLKVHPSYNDIITEKETISKAQQELLTDDFERTWYEIEICKRKKKRLVKRIEDMSKLSNFRQYAKRVKEVERRTLLQVNYEKNRKKFDEWFDNNVAPKIIASFNEE